MVGDMETHLRSCNNRYPISLFQRPNKSPTTFRPRLSIKCLFIYVVFDLVSPEDGMSDGFTMSTNVTLNVPSISPRIRVRIFDNGQRGIHILALSFQVLPDSVVCSEQSLRNILHQISNDGRFEPCPRSFVSPCPSSLSIHHNSNLERTRGIVLRSPALVTADNRKADRLDLA